MHNDVITCHSMRACVDVYIYIDTEVIEETQCQLILHHVTSQDYKFQRYKFTR